MIELALATLLANPCLAPAHHKHHVAPVQSCVTPTVPMCFRDTSDPEIAPVPQVLPYYITPTPDDGTQGEGPYIETGLTASVGYVGGVVETAAPTYYVPPTPPRGLTPVKTPEISAAGTMPALVLLLGGIAVLNGSKRS